MPTLIQAVAAFQHQTIWELTLAQGLSDIFREVIPEWLFLYFASLVLAIVQVLLQFVAQCQRWLKFGMLLEKLSELKKIADHSRHTGKEAPHFHSLFLWGARAFGNANIQFICYSQV